MTFTFESLRAKLKEALDLADKGEVVVIERRMRNTKGWPTKKYILKLDK